jgi:hypothetical protein
VNLHAGRVAVEAAAPKAPVLPRLLPESSHGDPLLPPPEVELALVAMLPTGGGSSRSSSIPGGVGGSIVQRDVACEQGLCVVMRVDAQF